MPYVYAHEEDIAPIWVDDPEPYQGPAVSGQDLTPQEAEIIQPSNGVVVPPPYLPPVVTPVVYKPPPVVSPLPLTTNGYRPPTIGTTEYTPTPVAIPPWLAPAAGKYSRVLWTR